MYRLLIVDDEPYIVQGLTEMLQMNDLPFKEICTAYSSEEALALFEQSAFDIVIADIKMPEMDGLELIGRIKSYWSFTRIIFLTGHSDFEYARRAMKLGASDYLLKPVEDEELIGCLGKIIGELETGYQQMMAVEQARQQARSALPALQAELFRDILDGGAKIDLSKLNEKLKALEFPFDPDKKVAVVVFRIDEWEDGRNTDDESFASYAVQNIVNEILESCCRSLSIRYDGGLAAILLQPREGSSLDHAAYNLKQSLVEAQDAVYRHLGVIISIAYAPEFITWDRMPELFAHVATLIRQSLQNGIFISLEAGINGIDNEELNRQLDELRAAIRNNDAKTFTAALDKSFSNNGALDQQHVVSLFTHVSSMLLQHLMQYNLTFLLDLPIMEKLSNLYRHKNTDSIKKTYIKVFHKVLNTVGSFHASPMEASVSQLKNYIENHLDEPLSLNELAGKVYLNSSYLSKIFHQIHGEQLSEYISGRKMEKARRLLLDGDMKIHEISEQVGFTNPNYFAKVFRKTYGLPPQDYRVFHSLHDGHKK